jgi:uncharacterized radical SAM superfamily Fe-S cluster-containing enzyme
MTIKYSTFEMVKNINFQNLFLSIVVTLGNSSGRSFVHSHLYRFGVMIFEHMDIHNYNVTNIYRFKLFYRNPDFRTNVVRKLVIRNLVILNFNVVPHQSTFIQ